MTIKKFKELSLWLFLKSHEREEKLEISNNPIEIKIIFPFKNLTKAFNAFVCLKKSI